MEENKIWKNTVLNLNRKYGEVYSNIRSENEYQNGLLDDVQRLRVMNWRFHILIHHSINLLPAFSSSVAASHDSGEALFLILMF